MPIGYGDVPYLRAKQLQLNAMLANQAAANGATLVGWYQASIGHHACKSSSVRLAGMKGAAAVLTAAVN